MPETNFVSIEELKFDEKGLIPAVVVDSESKKVLTVAYMNAESLKISMEKELTCFWSRSRQELWLKGETSGNYQHIVSITTDCDKDALVVVVEKDGPACHLGTDSCFEYPVFQSETRNIRSSRARRATSSRSRASMTCWSAAMRAVRKAPIPRTSSKRASTRS